ncbi:hypothetical protein KQX54_017940 [Cotesia glomerata]|uniref:Uncharacterized protein n=1 Tax=Cotesia glomerata TaxID=32391 RepID=A0AAV7HYL8_COTGL|nr:hypothetical protein KQX54_017940 [Cotesia glomerata]
MRKIITRGLRRLVERCLAEITLMSGRLRVRYTRSGVEESTGEYVDGLFSVSWRRRPLDTRSDVPRSRTEIARANLVPGRLARCQNNCTRYPTTLDYWEK